VPRKPTKPASRKPALRQWRVILLRKKGQPLGTVDAPDAATAIEIAIHRFSVTDPSDQRRLVAQPIE
jgi:hypothetical protein